MTSLAFRPTLEELNPRLVPSSVTVTPPKVVTGQIVALPSHPYQGDGQGQFTKQVKTNVGTTFQINGRLKLHGFGEFLSLGTIQSPGPLMTGQFTGQVTLHDHKGTIALRLHSLPRPLYSGVPFEMVYSIAGGTGAYAGLKGYGVAAFTFNTTSVYSLKIS